MTTIFRYGPIAQGRVEDVVDQLTLSWSVKDLFMPLLDMRFFVSIARSLISCRCHVDQGPFVRITFYDEHAVSMCKDTKDEVIVFQNV